MRLRNLMFVLLTTGPKTWDIEIKGGKYLYSREEFSISNLHLYGSVMLELFRDFMGHQRVTRRSQAGNSHFSGTLALEHCFLLLAS